MAAVIEWMKESSFLSSVDQRVIYVTVGSAGVAILGSIIYGIHKKRRNAQKVKTYPFKVIKPPTHGTGLEGKRTVAVLGATGFVGSQLVEHFIEQGQHRVYMLGRRFNEQNINQQADAVYQIDMTDYTTLEKAFEGVDSVVLSAIVLPTVYATAEQLYTLNIAGARNVLNAAKKAGVKNVILISGIKMAVDLKNAEANAVLRAFDDSEEAFVQSNGQDGLHTCVLAFGQIYGATSSWYSEVLKGNVSHMPLFDCRATFIPVERVCEATHRAEQLLNQGDNIAGGVHYLTGSVSSFREFFTHPNLSVRVKDMPMSVMIAMANMNRFIVGLTGFAPFGSLMSPAMMSLFGVPEQVYDPSIAEGFLGLGDDRPLDWGIERMVTKFRAFQRSPQGGQ